jgi:hypothetical protein
VTHSAIKVNYIWENSTYQNEELSELLDHFDAHVTESNKSQTLKDAVKALERSYSFMFEGSYPDEHKLRATFIWLYKMSDGYMALLKEGDSAALCVLAFFCVLLRRLDYYWWMEGWARHLIRQVYIALRPEHRMWIQWPMEEIGWAPLSPLS